MSLLRKIFGLSSAEDESAAAERLLDEGDPGSAKLRFERALGKTEKSNVDARKHLQTRIDACCDAIARGRLLAAQELLESGQYRLAEEELSGALEVTKNESLREEIGALLDESDRTQLLAAGAQAPTTTPRSQYAVMRSAEPVEGAQSAEYDSYGDAFTEALERTFTEQASEAVARFEAIVAEAKDPRYLHYELALAYRLVDDKENTQQHLRTFLSRIAADEGGIARIQAHAILANYLYEDEDTDAAIGEMQQAVEALPQNPSAYLELGNLLRRCGHPDEGADVLRAALDLDGGDHWYMRQSLGLALIEASRPEEAQPELEQVVDIFVQREDPNLPVEATEALARLFEQKSSFTKAADLYRLLCGVTKGPDAARYHLRAGQLLAKADKTEPALTMLKRAQALAEEYDLSDIAATAESERARALASAG